MSGIAPAIAPPRTWHDPALQLQAALESPWYRTITRLNASLLTTTASFYAARGIAPAVMPLTVTSVSSPMGPGSDSLPVSVRLFGERVHLADSMQFQLELLLRHGFDGVHYVMPTFRGEEPDDTHLNQFFHSEAEIAGDLEDVVALVEDYVRALARGLLGAHAADVAALAGGVDHLEDLAERASFPRLSYAEASRDLPAECFGRAPSGALVIRRSGEQALIERFGGPVWLTHPDRLAVPFYQARGPGATARSADLLLGVGEVAGCGARHPDGESVRRALDEQGVPVAEYAWYVHMKDVHPLQSAGFGLGLERLLLWVVRHDDIRDMHVMPRLKGHASWL